MWFIMQLRGYEDKTSKISFDSKILFVNGKIKLENECIFFKKIRLDRKLEWT